jgi:N-acetylmuramoyl-L-alanine amidase
VDPGKRRDALRFPALRPYETDFIKEKSPQMFYYLIMFCLSFMIFGTTISGDCWAEDFIIAIDIGHTINTPGATSARGVPEYLFNQNIGTLLYKQLLQDKRFNRLLKKLCTQAVFPLCG